MKYKIIKHLPIWYNNVIVTFSHIVLSGDTDGIAVKHKYDKPNFTELEKSQKEFHDSSIKLITKQISLIEDQKKYSRAIKWSAIISAIATSVMATFIVLQYIINKVKIR